MPRPTRLSPDVVKRIRVLLDQAETVRAIAKAVGFSKSTVHRVSSQLAAPRITLATPITCSVCREQTSTMPCSWCLSLTTSQAARKGAPKRQRSRHDPAARYEEVRRVRIHLD